MQVDLNDTNMNITDKREMRDEIDIGELIRAVWDGKWFVTAITTIIVVLGIAFYFVLPRYFSAEFVLMPVQRDDTSEYIEYNSLITAAKVESEGKYSVYLRDLDELTQMSLVSMFEQALRERDVMNDYIVESGLVDPKNYSSAVEFERAVSSEWQKFVFETDPPESPLPHRVTLRYNGSNRDGYLTVLEKSILKANSVVQQNLNEQFQLTLIAAKNNDNEEIAALKREIESERTRIREVVGLRVHFLKDQAEVARALGIEKGPLKEQVSIDIGLTPSTPTDPPLKEQVSIDIGLTPSTPTDPLFFYSVDDDYFQRGYLAIETAIAQLEARDESSLMTATVLEMEKKLRLLEQDTFLDRLAASFNRTSAHTAQGFKAAQLSLGAAKLQYTIRLSIVLAVSIMLGGIVGLMALFFRQTLRGRRCAHDDAY